MSPERLKVPRFFAKLPEDVIYVGRGMGGFKRSPFANPYVIGKPYTEVESRDLFRANVLPALDVGPLRGQRLACWCKLDAFWCHADDLIEAANR